MRETNPRCNDDDCNRPGDPALCRDWSAATALAKFDDAPSSVRLRHICVSRDAQATASCPYPWLAMKFKRERLVLKGLVRLQPRTPSAPRNNRCCIRLAGARKGPEAQSPLAPHLWTKPFARREMIDVKIADTQCNATRGRRLAAQTASPHSCGRNHVGHRPKVLPARLRCPHC